MSLQIYKSIYFSKEWPYIYCVAIHIYCVAVHIFVWPYIYYIRLDIDYV